METNHSRLNLQRIPTWAALEPFLDQFLFVDDASGGALPRLLPGTGATCYFNHGAPLLIRDVHSGEIQSVKGGILICNRHRLLELSSPGAMQLVVVNFRPGRLRHFTRKPFAELQDCVLPVADLWGTPGKRLADDLASAGNNAAHQAELLSHFLASQMHPVRSTELDLLLDQLYLCPTTKIMDIASAAGWSLRHFEREFAAAFGVTPKFFARLARLQRAARSLAFSPAQALTDAALSAGFYDQSHFNNELRRVAGLIPGELLRGLRTRPSFYNPHAFCWYKNHVRLRG